MKRLRALARSEHGTMIPATVLHSGTCWTFLAVFSFMNFGYVRLTIASDNTTLVNDKIAWNLEQTVCSGSRSAHGDVRAALDNVVKGPNVQALLGSIGKCDTTAKSGHATDFHDGDEVSVETRCQGLSWVAGGLETTAIASFRATGCDGQK